MSNDWGTLQADLNWLIIPRNEAKIPTNELPPKAEVINIKLIFGSSSTIRQLVAQGQKIDNFVSEEIESYIKTNNLYK